jgi:hypothetical protein
MHSTHYQGPFRRSTDASVDSPQPAAACANLSTILESTLSINFNCPEPNFGVNLTAKSGSNLDHVLTVLPVDALAILNGTDAGQLCSVLLVLSQSRREFPEIHAAVAKLLDKELRDGPARYSRITDRGDQFLAERSYQRHVQVTRCASRKVTRELGAFCLHSKSLDLVAAIQTLGSYVYDEVTRIAPAQWLLGVGRWLRALKISRLALPLFVMAHERSAYPAAARQAASLEMQRIEREMAL